MQDAELLRAREMLTAGGYTLVLVRGDAVEADTERGVKPLLSRLDSGFDYSGYSAADKVVGRAAACLYVLLGIRRLHAEVVSELALEVLSEHGISASYTALTKRIRNRTDTGDCPMESAVRSCRMPAEALSCIRSTLLKMQSSAPKASYISTGDDSPCQDRFDFKGFSRSF